jgi:polyphosphate kinase
MSKKKKIPLVNREISWLAFNERVLQEAADPTTPLFERLRFLGIYSNNRDEFFRVRVAALKRLARGGKRAREIVGEDPSALLEKIQKIVIGSTRRFDSIYRKIIRELKDEKIFIVNERQISKEQGALVRDYFHETVLPTLSAILLDQAPSFPNLKDRSIYFALRLERRDDKRPRYALIELSTDLPRFLVLPSRGERQYVMLVDDVIRYCLREIFPAREYATVTAHTMKLTLDAELDIDNDISRSLIDKISRSVKQRKQGAPVRFSYDSDMPSDLLTYVLRKLNVKSENIIPGSRYHNFRDFINFPKLGRDELRYEIPYPLPHPRFVKGRSFFDVIRERDVLLHYPYQSFHHIIDLLREASIDPRVESISMTLYRVAKTSNVINTLINACRNGKRVTVVVELQARFDEENNIFWANRLQEEGATIVFGVPHLKVHSKLFLISRKEDGKVVSYAHIGTGNLNETTARIYTDKTLLTADKRITNEVVQIFGFYRDNLQHGHYKHLLVSPFTLRKRFVQMINHEINQAELGLPAAIFIKINNIIDRQMIEKLYEASNAGVKIRMLVRGTCALVPGVRGFSENIEVRGVVDKFLEHERIFIFHNGGHDKFFIASADWMVRNLDHRSETAAPIYDKEAQEELREHLELQWRDNLKLRIIDRKQENRYFRNEEPPLRSQEAIYDWLKRKQRKSPKVRARARTGTTARPARRKSVPPQASR